MCAFDEKVTDTALPLTTADGRFGATIAADIEQPTKGRLVFRRRQIPHLVALLQLQIGVGGVPIEMDSGEGAAGANQHLQYRVVGVWVEHGATVAAGCAAGRGAGRGRGSSQFGDRRILLARQRHVAQHVGTTRNAMPASLTAVRTHTSRCRQKQDGHIGGAASCESLSLQRAQCDDAVRCAPTCQVVPAALNDDDGRTVPLELSSG